MTFCGIGIFNKFSIIRIKIKLCKIAFFNIVIFFFKDFGINTVSLSGIIRKSIICHFINKEQRQDFNSAFQQNLLTFKMALDSLSDLNAPQLFFSSAANHISGKKLGSILESNRVGATINMCNQPTMAIFIQLSG